MSSVVKLRNGAFRRNICGIRSCFPVGSWLDFGVFRDAARRGFVNGVLGLSTGTSALTLVRDLQILFPYDLRQPLSDRPRPEQYNASCSEPLLGDLDQLLERNVAGIAQELDQTRRLSQARPTFGQREANSKTGKRLTTRNH